MLRVDSFDEEMEYVKKTSIADNDTDSSGFEKLEGYDKDEFQTTGLYAAQILIRMNPRYLIKSNAGKEDAMPDLILWIDDTSLEENIEVIDQLRRGSVIRFQGYMHKVHVQLK